MSFENIQLPPILLQDLYKNFLIDEETERVLSHPLQKAEKAVLVGPKKNILILLKEPGKQTINKTDLTFLEGILKACNLTIDQANLLNIFALPGVDYTHLVKEYEPQKVLLFGVEPSDIKLPLVFPQNQIQQHISQLYASFPSLKNIAGEKAHKQALWATLQKLFKLV